MPGAQWLELLCRHIPDRYEHLVRFRRLILEPGPLVERAKALKGRATPTTPVRRSVHLCLRARVNVEGHHYVQMPGLFTALVVVYVEFIS